MKVYVLEAAVRKPQNLTGVTLVPNLITVKLHIFPSRHSRKFYFRLVAKVPSVFEIIFKALLFGGAHVIVTTSCRSHLSHATADYDQEIFQGFGSHASALTVVLFIKAGLQAECLRRLLTSFTRMLGSTEF